MSELRQNIATREWVIIATERAKRPADLVDHSRARSETLESYSEKCPFCEGNEQFTEKPTLIRERDGACVRIVPNKFPAVVADRPPLRIGDVHHRAITGFGVHDVVIEGGKHNRSLALMSVEEIALYLEVLRERCLQLARQREIQYVICFKNHGLTAGASLEHPHSQIIGLPIIPSLIRARMNDAMSYFDQEGCCVYCRMWRDETACGVRLIAESELFASFIPYAAFSPFHTWILPRLHHSQFFHISDEELWDLARILKDTLARIYFGLNDPDYNILFRMAPTYVGPLPWFHWYISLVPKVNRAAGFELGSGMFINPALPEDSAQFLRGVELPPEETVLTPMTSILG